MGRSTPLQVAPTLFRPQWLAARRGDVWRFVQRRLCSCHPLRRRALSAEPRSSCVVPQYGCVLALAEAQLRAGVDVPGQLMLSKVWPLVEAARSCSWPSHVKLASVITQITKWHSHCQTAARSGSARGRTALADDGSAPRSKMDYTSCARVGFATGSPSTLADSARESPLQPRQARGGSVVSAAPAKDDAVRSKAARMPRAGSDAGEPAGHAEEAAVTGDGRAARSDAKRVTWADLASDQPIAVMLCAAPADSDGAIHGEVDLPAWADWAPDQPVAVAFSATRADDGCIARSEASLIPRADLTTDECAMAAVSTVSAEDGSAAAHAKEGCSSDEPGRADLIDSIASYSGSTRTGTNFSALSRLSLVALKSELQAAIAPLETLAKNRTSKASQAYAALSRLEAAFAKRSQDDHLEPDGRPVQWLVEEWKGPLGMRKDGRQDLRGALMGANAKRPGSKEVTQHQAVLDHHLQGVLKAAARRRGDQLVLHRWEALVCIVCSDTLWQAPVHAPTAVNVQDVTEHLVNLYTNEKASGQALHQLHAALRLCQKDAERLLSEANALDIQQGG